jgi:hypothetical protein
MPDVETAGDRPATKTIALTTALEITVTPKMIEAGVKCLWRHPLNRYHPSEDEIKIVIYDVFIKMIESRLKHLISI